MSEPSKMFSVVLSYRIYEQLRALSRASETSVGGLLRQGADLVLKGKALEASRHGQR